VVRCGQCGASYQLETSGKRVRGDRYEYRYYCSKFCRVGSAVCSGYRIRTQVLDEAVLAHLAGIICTPERAEAFGQRARTTSADEDELRRTWAALVAGGGTISRSYGLHLVDHIEVRENEIRIVARTAAAPPEEVANESAAL
jgi:hypothetical protein